MMRAFNQREGFTRADDTLPRRVYEPKVGGATDGVAVTPQELERGKDLKPVRAAPKLWHAEAGAHLQAGLADRGYRLLADPEVQLAQLSAVCVPEGVDGKDVQMRLLREHSIEVGGGLGPDAPDIWRIGMMGTNAHTETADRLLEAFDAVLQAPRAGVSASRA